MLAVKPILLLLALAASGPVPGTFSGLVTNSAGRQLAGAEVVIHGTTSTGRHASFEQRTDAQGRYCVRVLAASMRRAPTGIWFGTANHTG